MRDRWLPTAFLSLFVVFLAVGLLWPAGKLALVAAAGADGSVWTGYNARALANTLLIGTGVALSLIHI